MKPRDVIGVVLNPSVELSSARSVVRTFSTIQDIVAFSVIFSSRHAKRLQFSSSLGLGSVFREARNSKKNEKVVITMPVHCRIHRVSQVKTRNCS